MAFEDYFKSGKPCPQRDILAFLVGRSYQLGILVVEDRTWIDPITGEQKTGRNTKAIPAHPSAIEAFKVALNSSCTQVKARAQFRLGQSHYLMGDKAKAGQALDGFKGLECDTGLYERYAELCTWLQQ